MLAFPAAISSFNFSSPTKTHAPGTLVNRQWRGQVTSCTATKTTWPPPSHSTCYLALSEGPCGNWAAPEICNPGFVDPSQIWLPGYSTETGQGRVGEGGTHLSEGQIAGIIVGSVVGALLLALLVWLIFKTIFRTGNKHGKSPVGGGPVTNGVNGPGPADAQHHHLPPQQAPSQAGDDANSSHEPPNVPVVPPGAPPPPPPTAQGPGQQPAGPPPVNSPRTI